MTIKELLDAAESRSTNDGFDLSMHYDDQGRLVPEQGDALGDFVVIELRETFDPDAPDRAQLDEGIRVIERAVEDLESVLVGLRMYSATKRSRKKI